MAHADAVAFFSELYGGAHHIPGPSYNGAANVRPCGHGWYVNSSADLATFDGSTLTRLVLLAHARCVRAEVSPAMRYLRIAIHPRVREGGGMRRHPTIEEAIVLQGVNP